MARWVLIGGKFSIDLDAISWFKKGELYNPAVTTLVVQFKGGEKLTYSDPLASFLHEKLVAALKPEDWGPPPKLPPQE